MAPPVLRRAPPPPSLTSPSPRPPLGRAGPQRGEVANRILSVGDHSRAGALAALLDPAPGGGEPFRRESSRGFVTYTGRYRGVPVSIVATLMGMANMDFVVRENRAVVDAPMAVVRLGSCGLLQPPAHLGGVAVAREALCCRRNPDAFDAPPSTPGTPEPFHLTRPIPADPALRGALAAALRAELGDSEVFEGTNVTADSFYSSQGRLSDHFDDRNGDLLDRIVERHPSALSLEMESFHLLDLARSSRGSLRAAVCAIGFAERWTNAFLEPERIRVLELAGGRAALATLAGADVPEDPLEGGEAGVWDGF